MLYTSIEKVKQHLVAIFPVSDEVFDQPVILRNNNYVTFFGGAIDSDSLKVKLIHSNELKQSVVTLGSEATALANSLLVRESIVAASDSSLGNVYIENVDYVIDYSLGTITIKESGNLVPGTEVVVWYSNYSSYDVGTDYTIDSSNGRIRRTSNSGIASGETVFMDYKPLLQSYNDVVLQNAVDEANGIIEKMVDPQQQFGVEPVLQTAATYRAVEIAARASASRELSSLRGEYNVAVTWLKLASDYAAQADKLIETFRSPFDSVSSPTHT